MEVRKLQRLDTCAQAILLASPTAIEWSLPADLLLEIVARSDIRMLVCAAAACKLLRSDILSPPFIRRITQRGGIVPQCIFAYLNIHDDKVDPLPPLTMVHPANTAATSFLHDHISPYLSCRADNLLGNHYPVTSRGGLILLHRRLGSNRLSTLCVYDPITCQHTFLSDPPDIGPNHAGCFNRCALLTAADGIDCSFLLFVPLVVTVSNNNNRRIIKFYSATSTCGTWAPAIISQDTGFVFNHWLALLRAPVVLHGSVIHWLVHNIGEIFTYNVCTTEQRTIKLPVHITNFKGETYLGSYYSHDGRKLLRLLGADGFKISEWRQLSGGDWGPVTATIDMEEKLRTLDPDIITGHPFLSEFKCFGDGSSAVFLRVYQCGSITSGHFLLTVLDLETKEMRMQEYSTPPSYLLEFDLPSRLRSMKVFQ